MSPQMSPHVLGTNNCNYDILRQVFTHLSVSYTFQKDISGMIDVFWDLVGGHEV